MACAKTVEHIPLAVIEEVAPLTSPLIKQAVFDPVITHPALFDVPNTTERVPVEVTVLPTPLARPTRKDPPEVPVTTCPLFCAVPTTK